MFQSKLTIQQIGIVGAIIFMLGGCGITSNTRSGQSEPKADTTASAIMINQLGLFPAMALWLFPATCLPLKSGKSPANPPNVRIFPS